MSLNTKQSITRVVFSLIQEGTTFAEWRTHKAPSRVYEDGPKLWSHLLFLYCIRRHSLFYSFLNLPILSDAIMDNHRVRFQHKL